MENITAEQFLEQPKKVQKIFLDWFENNADSYDLVCTDTKIKYISFYGDLEFEEKADYVPLLTEGQLRQFIEDKTRTKIDIEFYTTGYEIFASSDEYHIRTDNLFQAYWQVAIKIASEEVKKSENS